MKQDTFDNIEQMDPDFGRYALVGDGFGEITEEEYSKLVAELENDA